MVTFSALVIPEISNTILTYLLPSLLTLTFELDLRGGLAFDRTSSICTFDGSGTCSYLYYKMSSGYITTFTGTVLQVLLCSTYFAD